MPDVFRFDADPGIRHRHAQHVSLDGGADFDPPFFGKLDGVAGQIQKYLQCTLLSPAEDIRPVNPLCSGPLAPGFRDAVVSWSPER